MSKEDRNKASTGRLQRSSKGTFAPGVSGNPSGRPKGRRNEITLLKEALEYQLRTQIEDRMPEVFDKIVELALQGDRTMLKLLAEMHLTKGSGDIKAGQEKVTINVKGPNKTKERIIDVGESEGDTSTTHTGEEVSSTKH